MNLKNFLIMAAFVIATILLTLWLTDLDGPAVEFDPARPFLAELAERRDDIRQLQLTRGEQSLNLIYLNEQWLLMEARRFRADPLQVETLLDQLGALRPVRARSMNPDLYAELGVAENGDGLHIRALDENGTTIVSLIVGKRIIGAANRQTVRNSDEPRPWIVDSYIHVELSPSLWLDKNLLHLPAADVRLINYNDGELQLARDKREQTLLRIVDPQQAALAQEYLVPEEYLSSQAGILENLVLADYIPASDIAFDSLDIQRTTLITFDGLIINAELARQENRPLLRLGAAFQDPRELSDSLLTTQAEATPDEVFAEARALNLRHRNWIYVIPAARAPDLESPVIKRLSGPIMRPTSELPPPSAPAQ